MLLTGVSLTGFVGLGAEILPVADAAVSGNYTYKVLDDGTAEITGCNGSVVNAVIPDSIDGYTVTAINDTAFEWCDLLTTVEIPDSVTTIGASVFRYCYDLTTIGVAPENPNYTSDEYGVLFDRSKTTLIQYPAGNSRTKYTIPDSVTVISDSARQRDRH